MYVKEIKLSVINRFYFILLIQALIPNSVVTYNLINFK
jgi:hypothetical protein